MRKNYENLEDFLNDESFLSWVFRSDDNDQPEWDRWLADNPGKQKMVKEIAAVLLATRIKELPLQKQQIARAEERLRKAMMPEEVPAKVIPIKRKRIWYSVAAAVLILFFVGLYFIFQSSPKLQLATEYGQVRKNILPDGTEVILNAHSVITYDKQWEQGTTREVWIKGEAFFHVKKTPEHAKFIVHTDAFDIEVTGTSFNVINDDGKSSVILKEGSVKIHRSGEKEILMKPGDMVEYNNHLIEKKETEKQDYMAWTDNRLVFNKTPISEVAIIIEKHYGIAVRLDGDDIAQKTITGIMPNDNIGVLLQSLNATQEFKAAQIKDSIVITGFK